MILFTTDLLRLLLYKNILKERLDWLSIPYHLILPWLKNLDRIGSSASLEELTDENLRTLIKWGLVSRKSSKSEQSESTTVKLRRRPSLAFVNAVNLELTYDCPLDCNHCLQKSIRPGMAGLVIAYNDAIRILEGAWFSGLLTRGVNITGGETISIESPLIRIVEWLHSRGIPFRLNTSGWWGESENIKIGSEIFANSGELLLWLMHQGIKYLALSFDHRLDKYPGLEESLEKIAVLCEDFGINYEFVATGIESERLADFYSRLSSHRGINLRMHNTASMEMVDIGGAVSSRQELQSSSLSARIRRSNCSGRCYYRPVVLHISPDGGVRGCMYSPGAAEFGNVLVDSFPDLINRFHRNPAIQLFSENKVDDFIADKVKPYEKIYRDVLHPCAATVLVGRIAAECSGVSDSAVLRDTHKSIALKLGLLR